MPTQTRTTYDTRERVTADQFWSTDVLKWQTTTVYPGADRVETTPPAGGIPTTTLSDTHGRTIELRQHLGATTAAPYQATSYSYDMSGRLTQMVDPAGNIWTSTYDIGGRVTATTDPDKGATQLAYNPAGDLTSSTDARSITLSYKYDNLGRKIELWQGPVGTGTKRASWDYDTLAGGGSVKGHPVKSTRWHPNTGGTLEAYTSEITAVDDAYRPLTSTVSLPAGTMGTLAGPWTTSTTYKPDGSIATQTLPAAGSLLAETLTFGYDNTGLPLTMTSGLDSYISATVYHNWGAPFQTTLGTGTKRLQLQTTADEATRRLTENRVSTENQTTPNTWAPQLRERYDYDNAGNVKTIKEVTGSETAPTTVSNQCFNYDSLRRLTEAWTTTATTCQTTPSQAIVGGPDPYWTSYQYNNIGNRTKDTVHTTGGNTVRDYAYPASGTTSVRPHATTGVAITGLNPGSDSYGYDQVGNTTTRSIATKPTQTLTWDAEGNLATVTDTGGTTSYVYAPDGQRLLSYEPGSVTTLYLGSYELRRTTTGITCTRHYGVASRTTGAGLTWIAADHHGTGQVAINPTTLAFTRRKTDPFGNTRGPAAAWPTTRGFVNGVQDPTGLTHLGAREYEPAAGRFISVDPLMNLVDPSQWNGYSYANSNPTTASDPDGLIFCLEVCGSADDDWLQQQLAQQRKAEQRQHALDRNFECRKMGECGTPVNSKPSKGTDKNRPHKRWVDDAAYCGGTGACDVSKYPECEDGGSWDCELQLALSVLLAVEIILEVVAIVDPIPVVDEAVGAVAIGGTAEARAAAAERAGERDEAAGQAAGRAAAKCSFDPDTLVLMADGTTKSIKDIKVGDHILATDPGTGRAEAEPVTVLHVSVDSDLTDVTITGVDGTGYVLHTTAEHLFWSAMRKEWIAASRLAPGELVLTATGSTARVITVRAVNETAVMYNLTVRDIHTYYVLAGSTSVLVHNCKWEFDALSKSGGRSVGPDMSKAGQELSKHGGQGNFPVPRGTPKDISKAGQEQLDSILKSPGTKVVDITKGNFVGGKYYIAPDGRGAAFDANGEFQYFGVFTP